MNKEDLKAMSELQLKRKHLLRCIDVKYYNKKQRERFFAQLKETDKEIERLKFKIKIERGIKNVENSNTN